MARGEGGRGVAGLSGTTRGGERDGAIRRRPARTSVGFGRGRGTPKAGAPRIDVSAAVSPEAENEDEEDQNKRRRSAIRLS